MARQKQNSLAAGQCTLVVFEPVIHHNFGSIFPGVTGEEAEFGQLASERNEFSPQKPTSVLRGHVGESEREIAHADGVQPAMDTVYG